MTRKVRGDSEIVIFGRRAVLEALVAPQVEVLEVRVARGVPVDFRGELTAACRRAEIPLDLRGFDEVAELSRAGRHDQGVAARIRLLAVSEVESFLDGLKGPRARRPVRVLALDGVTNSQNVGMIVRSLVASECDALLWPCAGSPWVDGLVVKASAATVYRCPIVRCETLAEGLVALQAAGFQCLGLAREAEVNLFDWQPPHRVACVVGGETTGIGPAVGPLLDGWLRIPMARGVESLNVAVAAALVCFQAFRTTRG